MNNTKKNSTKKISLILTIICTCTPEYIYSKSIFASISDWFNAYIEEVVVIKEILEPNTNCIIENTQGNITIKSWNKNEFRIEATKRGTQDAVTQTDIKTACRQNNLVIRTTTENSQANCQVNYVLLVPKTTTITCAKTDDGTIEIRNCSQPITAQTYTGSIKLYDICNSAHVSTQTGSIFIQAYQLKPEHTLLAVTQTGSIHLEVPEKTTAHVYAETQSGKITTNCPVTLAPRTLKITQSGVSDIRKKIKGSIGSSEHEDKKLLKLADIKLTAITGNITLNQA